MDPNTTLVNILNDLREARNPNFSHVRRDEHKQAAAEALHDLAFWLEKGGFAPEVAIAALPAAEEALTALRFAEERVIL
jgi:hypothetical protein